MSYLVNLFGNRSRNSPNHPAWLKMAGRGVSPHQRVLWPHRQMICLPRPLENHLQGLQALVSLIGYQIQTSMLIVQVHTEILRPHPMIPMRTFPTTLPTVKISLLLCLPHMARIPNNHQILPDKEGLAGQEGKVDSLLNKPRLYPHHHKSRNQTHSFAV